MTKDTNDISQDKLGLSTAQVVGSALAAVSGAFLTSWAGTAGTLIGAAVASVIATVGAASYTWWLRRTSEAMRRTAAQVRQTGIVTTVRPRTAGGSTVVESRAAELEDLPDVPRTGRRWTLPQLPWAKVLLASAVVMLVAMAGITGFEALTGRSLASYTGQDSSHSTTLGSAVDPGPGTTTKRSTTNQDSGNGSDTGTGSTGPSTGPSTVPSPTPTPSDAATPAPTPTPTSSTDPLPSTSTAPSTAP